MPPQLGIGLIIILAAILIAIGLRRLLVGGDALGERLKVYAALPDQTRQRKPQRGRGWVMRLRMRMNAIFSGFASQELTLQLMSAYWPVSATEYVVMRLIATALGFILGWLISDSPLGGAGLGILANIIPGLMLKISTNRRRQRFSRQLVDVLVLMTGSVRAGFSLLQAMEMIVREMAPPASEEFEHVLREVGIGRSVSQALGELALRMQNKDLNLLVTAINIQYQVGGNMTTMLESVTETIRERIRLFGEVRVITTQQRITSYVLSLLPFFVAGIMFLVNPDYMVRLFDPSIRCIPIGALLGIILGFIIVQRMTRLDI
ncbi:MAG: type II secretion system F family protein [Anaerolineales bacterium]